MRKVVNVLIFVYTDFRILTYYTEIRIIGAR
jgi:hypothetical protein